LFNRLEKDLENNNIICPEQIGFKRGARTSDHMFTLKYQIDNFFVCKSFADFDISTMSSAYNKQDIDFPFILNGSHSKLKCSTKLFI
jgi:hypothetical protein